jgi:carboxylate-amine ligase
VRSLDVQATPGDTAAIAALTHCLARHAADADPRSPIPPELIEEGLFRAARFGTEADLPDEEGSLRPVSELLGQAQAVAEPYADELGCRAELEALTGLVERGGGAGRQRRYHQIAGMDALLRELTALTGG